MGLELTSIWTPERMALARASAAKWAGTPHFDRLALPGEGVDCIRFVCEVLWDSGIGTREEMPFYDSCLGRFRRRNIIADLFLRHLPGEKADWPPAFGDVIVCRCGRQSNHVGICIDDRLWHVPAAGRVGPEPLTDWRPRIETVVRLTGTDYRESPAGLTWEQILSLSHA